MPDVVKVTLNNETLMDISDSTVEASNVLSSYIGYEGDGDRFTGSYVPSGGGRTHTATVTGSGALSYAMVRYNNTNYCTTNDTFTFTAGDTLYCEARSDLYSTVIIDGTTVASKSDGSVSSYNYTLPDSDIVIHLSYSVPNAEVAISFPKISITENGNYNVSSYYYASVSVPVGVFPSGTLEISMNGTYNVTNFSSASINVAGGVTDYLTPIIERTISGTYTNDVVTVIGREAFAYANKITEVSFANATVISSSAFYGCSMLSSVSFPEVTEVGPQVFQYTKLAYAYFPKLKSLGTSACDLCSSLESFIAPSLEYIGYYAFRSCTKLSSINFPLLTYIGTSAFNSAKISLASFSLVSQIGGSAFLYCPSLLSADFPITTSIGSSGFYSCSKLAYISFPMCATLGSYVFAGCGSLSHAALPSCGILTDGAFKQTGITQVSGTDFPVCTSVGAYAFTMCSKLTDVEFSSCIYIGSQAFSSCGSLATVSFPACTNIGLSAFSSCPKLVSTYFPNCSVIGAYAFNSCLSLATISFPACTSIGSQAFKGCSILESAYFLNSSFCSMSLTPFAATPMYVSSYLGYFGSIFVPSSMVDTYKTATNWVTYSDRITSYVE